MGEAAQQQRLEAGEFASIDVVGQVREEPLARDGERVT